MAERSDFGERGGKGIVLYDGVCVLCSGWFRFVAARDVERNFMFTAVQSDYGHTLALKLGIDLDNSGTNAVLVDGEVYLRSDSALAVLASLPMWRWTRIFRWVPKPLRDCIYDCVARNRYQLLGRHAACDLGGQKFSDRLVS